MHTTAKKLKSQRGASLIFALLVFMLCAFAGSAALVSASANAGRYARLEQDQQQYLSASSAATLLRDELHGQEIKVELTLRHTYTWWYVDTTPGDPDHPTYALCSCHEYFFVDGPGEPAGDPPYYKPEDACKITLSTSTSSLMTALTPLLKTYFSRSFLFSDVPAYFFGQQSELAWPGSADPIEPAGLVTADRPTLSATGETCRLVITGQPGTSADADDAQWDEWRTVLGTVRAELSDIGDYGLCVAVSEQPGDPGTAPDPAGPDATLYTTVFELPAQVQREIKTKVIAQDEPDTPPAVPDSMKGKLSSDVETAIATATSYGRRVTDNTVTVTVTWTDRSPVVTRLY